MHVTCICNLQSVILFCIFRKTFKLLPTLVYQFFHNKMITIVWPVVKKYRNFIWWWCIGRMHASEYGFCGIFMCTELLPLFPLLEALQGVHVPWTFLPMKRLCHFQTYDSLRPSTLVNLYLSLYLETMTSQSLRS